jgi:hypothetical protein
MEDRLRLSVTIELRKCDEIKSQGCGKRYYLLIVEVGDYDGSASDESPAMDWML